VRGECLMTGYYRNEAETEAYFRTGDGWGWSGDLATVDRDGFITLAGRAKDMIISGGINVYPREIEVVLEAHPAVSECTAFGVPDDRWGESLVAYVVLRDGEGIEPEALIAHCGAQLARYKRPRAVKLVDAIPKTASGKVLKHRLREAYLAGR
jgi:fatty-acyl-CoA synthase